MTLLVALYTLASLAHFIHNAEFIAFYPGVPVWMTRESVYLAWLGVAGVGLLGLSAARLQWPRIAAALLLVYGALGVDGLLHYTLALCSEHTLAMNITIWAEVTLGLALACASAIRMWRLGAWRSGVPIDRRAPWAS
ncbi:MAG: hypothetical protein U1E71_03495 [Ramlibacter sp.]